MERRNVERVSTQIEVKEGESMNRKGTTANPQRAKTFQILLRGVRKAAGSPRSMC